MARLVATRVGGAQCWGMIQKKSALAGLGQLREGAELRAALAAKEVQLNAVLEAARMASWRRDPATGRTTTSELMADLWGLLPGQTFEGNAQDYQLLHPHDVLPRRSLSSPATPLLTTDPGPNCPGEEWDLAYAIPNYPSARRQIRMARGTRH